MRTIREPLDGLKLPLHFDVGVENPTLQAADIRVDLRPATKLSEPAVGPLMVEHPLIRLGRPVSLLDIWMSHMTASATLQWDERIVPTDRDFSRPMADIARLPFEVKTIADLHNEYAKAAYEGGLRWRGRPSKFLAYPLNQLIHWREAFFEGRLTNGIRGLAALVGVSEPAASRFVHGETLWYL